MSQLSLPFAEIEAPLSVARPPRERAQPLDAPWLEAVGPSLMAALMDMESAEFSAMGEPAREVDATLPPETWLSAPNVAFNDWQRNTTSSEGLPYAKKSILQHCAMFRRFVDYVVECDLDLATLSGNDVGRFLQKLTSKDGSPAIDATRQRYLKLLHATFSYLRRIGVRTGANPCMLLNRFNVRELDVAPVSLHPHEDDTFVGIVLAQEARNWRDVRDQAMLVLIIASGLYAAEIIHLQVGAIHLETDPPFLQIDAHGKVPERKAPISPFAIEPLRRWLTVRATLKLGAEQTVFVSTQGGAMLPATLYKKCKRVLGGHADQVHPKGGFGPQVLRNAFLVRQLAANKPLPVVQQWAGHVETKSTARFLRCLVNPGGVNVM